MKYLYLKFWPSLILIFCSLWFVSFERIKENPRAVIWSDSEGYYKYLPGIFILKDFHKLDAGSVLPYFNQKGEYVDKYTCGVAYLEAPFFLIAYFLDNHKNSSSEPFYYSSIYSKSIAFGGVLFGFLGLLLMADNLQRRFNAKIAILCTALIFFGTNLFHYITKEMGTSHVYSFFLFNLLISLSNKFVKKPNFIFSSGIGLVLGIISLIRPTNLIVALLLISYNSFSFFELKKRILFYFDNIKQILIIFIFLILAWIPQILYWKEMTGKYFYYSYQEEGFKYWKNPKILEVLFDIQNGLFLYSPLYLIPILVITFSSYRKYWESKIMLFIFIFITYLFSSWWAWWFGGAFGHRCYVEYTAIFVIPLGYFINYIISNFNSISKQITFIGLLVLCFYSVRLSYLYTSIGGPWDGADWHWNLEKYFWILRNVF